MSLYEILERIIKRLGIDWVIERNVQDGWTVEKWHSGKMVQTLYKATDNVGWNDIPYITGLIVSHKIYTFPQHFIGIPVVSASVTGGTGIGVGVTTHPTNNDVQLHVTGSQSCTGSAAKDISIMAIGKWK